MADAGMIETSGGHSRAFRVNVNAWRELLRNIETPIWRRRAEGFAFVLRWQKYLREKDALNDTEFSLGVSFRASMTEFWRLCLEADVTQEPMSDDPANAWAPRAAAIDALKRWFEDRAHYGDEYDGRR
jgi:hypothetical protein